MFTGDGNTNLLDLPQDGSGMNSNSLIDDDVSSQLTHTDGTFVKLNNVDDVDNIGPCPWCEAMFGTSIVYQFCCCCFWNENDRRKCAIGVLYSKVYLLLYLAIIVITVTLLMYDFTHGFEQIEKKEPGWFVGLDITCVTLMVVDVFVQILANPTTYWKSATNVFDFVVVAICVIGVPVYFYVPQSDIILTIVLLLRFGAQLLRIIMIFKHQKRRREYIDATQNDIVDFSRFQDSADMAKKQGMADDGHVIVYGSPTKDLSKNIKDMTPEWKVIENNSNSNSNSNLANQSNNSITPVITSQNNNISSKDKNKDNDNQSLTGAIHNIHNKGYDSFSEAEKDKDAASQHSLSSHIITDNNYIETETNNTGNTNNNNNDNDDNDHPMNENRNKLNDNNNDNSDNGNDNNNSNGNDDNENDDNENDTNNDNNNSSNQLSMPTNPKRTLSDDSIGITPVVI